MERTKKRFQKKNIATVFVILVTVLLGLKFYARMGGWGPSNIEVIETYRERFDPIRKNLQEIAVKLDAESPIEEVYVKTNIAPRPILKQDDYEKSNVAMMALGEFTESAEGGDLHPDYFAFNHLENFWFGNSLEWTGENNPLAHSVLRKNGANLERKLRAALGVKYIILGRINGKGENAEEKDRADPPHSRLIRADAFLVQIDTQEVVARVPVEVSIEPNSGMMEFDQIGTATLRALHLALGDRATIEADAGL